MYFCRNTLVLLVHCPNYEICWENSWLFLMVKQLLRGFSVNQQVMIKNIKEHTFIVQRTIYYHIQRIRGSSQSVVSRELLTAASAGRRYSAYLEEQKKEQQQASQNRKWKIVLEEKAELEKKKKKRLDNDISALQLDADSLGNKAKEKTKLVLLSKSNALRKAATEKESPPQKIEDELRELAKKSANLWSRSYLLCKGNELAHESLRGFHTLWLNWIIISKIT